MAFIILGECISGALHWETLVKLANQIGFSEPRLAVSSLMEIGNEELQKVVGQWLVMISPASL